MLNSNTFNFTDYKKINMKKIISVHIPQGTNYTVTCLPSRKLSKLDELDMQDTAGEAETSS